MTEFTGETEFDGQADADIGGGEVSFAVEPAEAGVRLDRFLQGRMPDITRSQLQHAIRDGRVLVDGFVAPKTGLALKTGMDVAYMPLPSLPSTLVAQDLGLEFLHVDPDLVIVNKPAGLVVHPAAGHADGTLVNGMLHAFPDLRDGGQRPGIVHRLDRGTSGCLAVGRTTLGREQLMLQFLNRKVFKGYFALICGIPVADSGVIDRPIARHPGDRKRYSSVEATGRDSITMWRKVASTANFSLLAVRILTGRTHQIRVHLADNGWPVAGDTLYGLSRQQVWQRLEAEAIEEGPLLHAGILQIRHPKSGEPLTFFAPLPQRWQAVLERLFPGLPAKLSSLENVFHLFPQTGGR